MRRQRIKRYFDVEDASRYLGCHVETVREMIRHGRLKPVDSTPPFYFDRHVIESLPPIKVGRPKKSITKEVRMP